MLTELELKAFKCFEHVRLPLQRLTVLSGINAAGKSTVMQALLLLHQTLQASSNAHGLLLNGPATALGTVADLVNHSAEGGIEIRLGSDGAGGFQFGWAFRGERDSLTMEVAELWEAGQVIWRGRQGEASGEQFEWLLPKKAKWHGKPAAALGCMQRLANSLAYLSAERTGPRDTYPLEEYEQHFTVSANGDNVAGFIFSHGDYLVPLSFADAKPDTSLRRHIESWMGRFFPGFAMEVNKVPRSNSVTLGIRTSGETDYMRTGNTGFGITQVLPIVVAALSREPEGMLLVENPEVHLHPAGQALMGQFLSEAAKAGEQVIVETHSDHVLNGIRRAVKSGVLRGKDVAIYFFRPVDEDDRAQVESIEIDDHGKITHWPEGFFDQFEKDTAHFAGWD